MGNTMHKLLAAYAKTPTLEIARKIYQYDKKHPMASATLSPDEIKLMKAALRQERDVRCPVFGRPSVSLAGM